MKKITFILSLFFIMPCLYASSPADEAAEYYRTQNYDKALEIYKTINDGKNPYILYNIANCYYKLNDSTDAMIYYLKAFKLMPRNKNIRENLIRVSKENGNIIFSEDIPSFIYSIYYFFSDIELKGIFELFLFLSIILLIIHTRRKDDRLTGYTVISSFVFAVFFVLYILRINSSTSDIAVTISDSELYSGPDKKFSTLAVIPKGKIIKIISDDDTNYIEAGVMKDNLKGWVEKDSLVKI